MICNIIKDVFILFIDIEDDYNIVDFFIGIVGYFVDGGLVLISDNWDIWQVFLMGGVVKNFIGNGKEEVI